MKHFRKESGSATLEMTFVFPMIIFVIVIMLFFGMFLYEQVAAKAVLDDVVSRAAANWVTVEQGVYTEQSTNVGFTALDVYSRIIDFNDVKKKENITGEALRRLRVVCPFSNTFQDNDVSLKSTNLIVYKQLDLTVDRTYELPFGHFLESIGGSSELHYRLTSSAIVEDPSELIRTIDIAADMLEQSTRLKSLYDKAQEAMGKITEFFRSFNLAGD